jgi:hypothetical protein
MLILRLALIPVLILLVVVHPHPALASERAPVPHLRPLDARLEEIVALGMRDSPSFRALVARLDASDVVVYIRCARRLRTGLEGQLTFVGTSAGLRYVVVALEPTVFRDRLIATLGHELRHAVEIADTPSIVDSLSLGVAYARMGRSARVGLQTVFDTDEAEEAGKRVWREILGRASRAETTQTE